MAEKLGDDANKVVQLPARAARGAGKSKPTKPGTQLKPDESEREAKGGNGPPTDAEIRANLQDRLIALTAKHRAVDNKIDVIKAELDEVNGEKKEIRTAIENSGFRLDLFDEGYSVLRQRTKRIDLEAKEKMRDLMWEAWGLPRNGAQPDLLKGVPKAAKPAVYWEAQGYQAGITGDGCGPEDLKTWNVPPGNETDFTRGWHMAMERNSKGLKRLEEDAAIEPPTALEAAADEREEAQEAEAGEPAAVDEALASGEEEDEPEPGAPETLGEALVEEGEGRPEFLH